MVRIGIIGSDWHLAHLSNLLRDIEEFELTGWINDGYNNESLPLFNGLVTYPSLDALFQNVDAIAVNSCTPDSISIIIKSLKHFKHVLLMDAQSLTYTDYNTILKIAEESDVTFYPEFGCFMPESIENFTDCLNDIQYIDINQTFSLNEGICVDGRLSLALLRNVNFITSFLRANVKKINANGWGFSEPGAGMLNSKIDFDNGASANMLLVNSIKPRQVQAVLYGKSETISINAIDNIFRISRESLLRGLLGCTEKIYSADCSLKNDLRLFLLAMQQSHYGLRSIENKHKSIRITHLIQEKINQFASISIFYS